MSRGRRKGREGLEVVVRLHGTSQATTNGRSARTAEIRGRGRGGDDDDVEAQRALHTILLVPAKTYLILHL